LGRANRGARGRGGRLTDKAISRTGVLGVVKKRAEAAGLPATLSNHSFRATGITNYLAHGGDLETALACRRMTVMLSTIERSLAIAVGARELLISEVADYELRRERHGG
jgi:hypothetical protein